MARQIIASALLALLCVAQAWGGQTPKADPVLAHTLYQKGFWSQAAIEYGHLLRESPSLDNYRILAEIEIYRGDYEEAEKALRAAERLAPGDGFVRYSRAALKAIDKNKKRYFDDLLQLSGEFEFDSRYWRTVGLAFLRAGLRDDSLQFFEFAVRSDPGDYMAWFFIGIVYELRLDFDSAMAPYKRSLAANPVYAQAVNNLGYNYKERHYYTYAAEKYHEAIRLNPLNAGYYYNLGNIYNHEGHTDVANVYYRRAVALDPTFHKAHYNLGKTSVRLGYVEEGIRELKLYLKFYDEDLSERDVPKPPEVKEMIEFAGQILLQKRAMDDLDISDEERLRRMNLLEKQYDGW